MVGSPIQTAKNCSAYHSWDTSSHLQKKDLLLLFRLGRCSEHCNCFWLACETAIVTSVSELNKCNSILGNQSAPLAAVSFWVQNDYTYNTMIWTSMHSHAQIHVHLCKAKLLEKVIVINIQPWCTCVSLTSHLLLYCIVWFPNSINCSPGITSAF